MKGLGCRKRSIKYHITDSEYRLRDLDENYSIFDNIEEFNKGKALIWRSSILFSPSRKLRDKSYFNDIETIRQKSCTTAVLDGGDYYHETKKKKYKKDC